MMLAWEYVGKVQMRFKKMKQKQLKILGRHMEQNSHLNLSPIKIVHVSMIGWWSKIGETRVNWKDSDIGIFIAMSKFFLRLSPQFPPGSDNSLPEYWILITSCIYKSLSLKYAAINKWPQNLVLQQQMFIFPFVTY